MTKAQKQTILKFINNAESFFRFSDSSSGIEYLNGPVVWNIELSDSGKYWLRASNITNEWRWFMGNIHINVLIGKKGGIKFYSCEGIKRSYLAIK